MKFVLRTEWGSAVPNVLTPLLNKAAFPQNRYGEIVDWIEQNAIPVPAEKIAALIKRDHNHLFTTTDKNGKVWYLGWSDYAGICKVDVVDIDTTKRWRIREYDGAEYVEYIDDVQCINEKINLYKG